MYWVFIDESGNHGLESVESNEFPVFVLTAALFREEDYFGAARPLFERFKMEHIGHPWAVLHSYDIRNMCGDFSFLQNPERRARFLADLNSTVEALPVRTINAVIDKRWLVKQYVRPDSPYDLALTFILERACYFIGNTGESIALVAAEAREARQNSQFLTTFRRFAAEGSGYVLPSEAKRKISCEPFFINKKANAIGLQVADLLAYPLAKRYLEPRYSEHLLRIALSKMHCSPEGQYIGYGLKVFPTNASFDLPKV